MPIIRVEMWAGRTQQQKAELAQAITDAVVNIARTSPESTIVIFDDVQREDWAENGKLSSES